MASVQKNIFYLDTWPAECQADISLGILRSQEDRAIEWMPALCTPGNATIFYGIRLNASSSYATLTVVNSR